MRKIFLYCFACLLTLQIAACSKEEESKPTPRLTLVTVTTVQKKSIETTQETIGSLEGMIDPTVAAEVSARVVEVHVKTGQQVKKGQIIATLDASDFAMQRNEARAEVARIQAQLENQKKVVSRNQALVDKNFISQNAVDNETAQLSVLKEQLSAAKARVGSINHSSRKSRIHAPISGVIEKRMVGAGDFVSVGAPIVQIVSKQKLRAHLPFPEYIGTQLKPGLKVKLSTPASNTIVETTIRELKPMISAGNRTIDVIADVTAEDGWQPGASVNAQVVLAELPSAIMVPEQSVVLRPAGKVVYVIKNKVAYQTVVETGIRQQGLIEIKSGLNDNQTIVVDGAGFLTDNTPVQIAKDDATWILH